VLALAESLDHVGPIARSVEDAAILFDAIAGYDANDPTSRFEPVQGVRSQLARGIVGMRIGVDRSYAFDGVEPELKTALEKVLEILAELGAEIVDVKMPDVSLVGDSWWDTSTAEAAAFHAATYPSRRDAYGAGFLDALDYGSSVTGVQFANAQKMRLEVAGKVNALLSGIDCVVCPSMSNSAHKKLENPFIPETNESWALNVIHDVHSKPFNFAGCPTLSVPCGFSSDGLPFSVQFVGSALDEAKICRVGYAFEQATEWHQYHPDLYLAELRRFV